MHDHRLRRWPTSNQIIELTSRVGSEDSIRKQSTNNKFTNLFLQELFKLSHELLVVETNGIPPIVSGINSLSLPKPTAATTSNVDCLIEL